MSSPRRVRPRFDPSGDNLQLAELEARYNEVRHRVRDDNPWDVVLLKVQHRRLFASLERHYGKVAARGYVAVQQLDGLIEGWYAEHRRF